jgi:hypothetical protein
MALRMGNLPGALHIVLRRSRDSLLEFYGSFPAELPEIMPRSSTSYRVSLPS